MHATLGPADLEAYVRRLVANHLPDGCEPRYQLAPLIDVALQRLDGCFASIDKKYYRESDGNPRFDHMHGDHFASFLYFLGNTIWRDTGDEKLPTRLFYLNKIMHGLDLFYSVEMPEVFLLVHPIGTVLGRAKYGNFMVIYQNCTVGADTNVYPRFGEGVILYSRSTVLGDCTVGDNVVFAANAMVVDTAIPADTVVVGQYPNQRFVRNRRSVKARCFLPG